METVHLYNFTPANILTVTKASGKEPLVIKPRQTVAYSLPDETYASKTFVQDRTAASSVLSLAELIKSSSNAKARHGFPGIFYTMVLSCNGEEVATYVYALARSDSKYAGQLGEFVALVNGWTFTWIRTDGSDPVPVGFEPFDVPSPSPGPAPAPMPAGGYGDFFYDSEEPMILEHSNFGAEPAVTTIDFLRVCYPKTKRGGCDYSEESHYAYNLDRVFNTPRGCMQ